MEGMLLPANSPQNRLNTANVTIVGSGANRNAAKRLHLRNKVPLLSIPKTAGSSSPPVNQPVSNEDRYSCYNSQEENPMMESVEVDLSKHLKPRGFPTDQANVQMNSSKMFDQPEVLNSHKSQKSQYTSAA